MFYGHLYLNAVHSSRFLFINIQDYEKYREIMHDFL